MESRLNHEVQFSETEETQDSLQDLKLDRYNQSPESLEQDQEQPGLHGGPHQVQVQDKRPPDPAVDRLEGGDQNPAGDCDRGDHHQSIEQNQDLSRRVDLDRVLPRDQDQDQHQHQDLTTSAANQEAAGESGGSVPALVITQAEEPLGPAVTPADPQRPADLVVPVSPTEPSLSSSSDGGDMACCDLLSLRSDSLSLASEPTISRTSEDEDSRSVAASSVMSLFHRVQLDPLEKDWWRSSALGNMAAQRQLLCQESSLVSKKTALHWAAKQGRQEAVDMMLRYGADVNARSGYTALHLASIHGHQPVVHALINTYNAKTNIRDYHGRTAVHYWTGSTDIFNKPDCQSGGRSFRGRPMQRYALPSLLLTRSRSQGQLNLEFKTVPPSASHDVLDLHL